MDDTQLTRTVAAFVDLSSQIIMRLREFRLHTGEDQFPRAFSDITQHVDDLQKAARELKTRSEHAGTTVPQPFSELQRIFDGCSRQLHVLSAVLDRCLSNGISTNRKSITRSLKDVYSEKEIPQIQKTLHGYGQSISKMLS